MSKRESIELEMPDGRMLRGIYSCAASDQAAPVVVFAHGLGSARGGEKSAAIEVECGRRGWAFAAFDFRGHGESGGLILGLRGSRLLEDLDFITADAVRRAKGPLLLVGSSMGGWASAWFAATNPERVAACAFVAPSFRFLEWNHLSEIEREAWRRTGLHRVSNEFVDLEISYEMTAESDQFKFETLAGSFRTPAIIFHGMADTIVPYATSLEFASACASKDLEVLIIKNGDHRLNRNKEQIASAACDFFAGRW